MARKPMSQAQRDAFRDRMALARAARGGKAAPRKAPTMARRGRRAKQKAASDMTDAEFVLRQQEAAALLGGTTKKRRGRRGGKRRAGGGIVAFIMGGGKRSAAKTSKRKGTRMARRGKKGSNAQQSYSQLTGQLPVQVSIELAEGLFSMGSVGIDIYTASTKSAADDITFPIVQRVLSSAGRWAAQRYLARKHPGLAATVAHGFSAMNGDRNGNFIRNNMKRFLRPATP